jgi:hypothetical protein
MKMALQEKAAGIVVEDHSGRPLEGPTEGAREARARVWEKIHTPEKEDAIQLVTLDRALGLRFLSLLECQLFISLAPFQLAHHSPLRESLLPDWLLRTGCLSPSWGAAPAQHLADLVLPSAYQPILRVTDPE